VNLLGAKILTSTDANLHGLLKMLRDPFDIIWFATHGDEQGVYLTDGILNASELTSLVRSSTAQLTVFNTCSSRSVALTIHDELATEFICTVKPVPDRTAFITGTIFAQKLADGLDFFDAYEAAKPGQNSTYTYIGEKGKFMPPREPNRYTPPGNSWSPQPQMPDAQTLNNFIESLKDLSLTVKGQAGLVPPIREMIADLQKQVARLEERLASVQGQLDLIQRRQIVRNTAMWSMAIAIAILLLTVAIMSHRLGMY
jgi:hypothetical protein